MLLLLKTQIVLSSAICQIQSRRDKTRKSLIGINNTNAWWVSQPEAYLFLMTLLLTVTHQNAMSRRAGVYYWLAEQLCYIAAKCSSTVQCLQADIYDGYPLEVKFCYSATPLTLCSAYYTLCTVTDPECCLGSNLQVQTKCSLTSGVMWQLSTCWVSEARLQADTSATDTRDLSGHNRTAAYQRQTSVQQFIILRL